MPSGQEHNISPLFLMETTNMMDIENIAITAEELGARKLKATLGAVGEGMIQVSDQMSGGSFQVD